MRRPNIKNKIPQADSTDIVVLFKSVRNTFRCLKNEFALESMEPEALRLVCLNVSGFCFLCFIPVPAGKDFYLY